MPRLKQAAQRVMAACTLVESLRSLDRRQMELASDHFRMKCSNGPRGALILQDAGCIPVLVELLALEGTKNTKIVANCLYSTNMLCLETDFVLGLSQEKELPGRLDQLYRSENVAFRRFVASITCRMFNQLANVGMEHALVKGRSKREGGKNKEVPDTWTSGANGAAIAAAEGGADEVRADGSVSGGMMGCRDDTCLTFPFFLFHHLRAACAPQGCLIHAIVARDVARQR